MKHFVINVGVLILVGLFLSEVTVPSNAYAQSAQEDRTKLMKTMRQNIKKLKKATGTQAMLASAKIINESVKKLSSNKLWPKGSNGGVSRAKIEIWQNMAAFKGKLKNLENASAHLIKVSMGGNLGNSKKAFNAMAKNCGGCHKYFRGPKKK